MELNRNGNNYLVVDLPEGRCHLVGESARGNDDVTAPWCNHEQDAEP